MWVCRNVREPFHCFCIFHDYLKKKINKREKCASNCSIRLLLWYTPGIFLCWISFYCLWIVNTWSCWLMGMRWPRTMLFGGGNNRERKKNFEIILDDQRVWWKIISPLTKPKCFLFKENILRGLQRGRSFIVLASEPQYEQFFFILFIRCYLYLLHLISSMEFQLN